MIYMYFHIVFWLCLLTLIYIYCGYLIFLIFISKIKKAPPVLKDENYTPLVSLIITAYNEEKHIGQKLSLVTNLDYPTDKLEIIVCSDASEDRTDEIVKSYAEKGVVLVRLDKRGGKTKAQSEGVKRSKGEIIIFTDATTEFNKESVKKLISNFADPTVGAAGGELYYRKVGDSGAGEGGGLYWKYEKLIKKSEEKAGILLGVSGALLAVRKEIYDFDKIELIEDFYLPLRSVILGKRNAYEPGAIAYEETMRDIKQEWKMRTRVAVHSYNVLWQVKSLFNPFKYGFASIALFSHKLLRYLAAIFMIILFFANIVLAFTQNLFYLITMSGQILFYILVLIEWGYESKTGKKGCKLSYIPFYLCLVNAAAFKGLLMYLKGERLVTWKPIRD